MHAFTAHAGNDDRTKYRQLGFDGVLTKPITPTDSRNFSKPTSMPATTATEFDAAYFRGLFGSDEASWAEFISVSLTSPLRLGNDLAEAISTGDMETISSAARHRPLADPVGRCHTGKIPSPVGHLEHGGIPPLGPEFDALLAAFDTL